MRRLATFFVLAFAFTWAILGVEFAAEQGMIAFHLPPPVIVLAGFGPAVAALIMVGADAGRAGVRDLLGRLLRFRTGAQWYLIALLGPAAIILAALGVDALLGGAPNLSQPPILDQMGDIAVSPWLLLPVVFVAQLLTVGEELGWRGYALPRLQDHFSAVAAALILGVLWGLWHLPMIFTPAAGAAVSDVPLWLFLADIIASSVLYTWVFNNTGGSVLHSTLLHASNNTTPLFLSFLPGDAGGIRIFVIIVIVRWLVTLAVLLATNAETLTRQPERLDQVSPEQ